MVPLPLTREALNENEHRAKDAVLMFFITVKGRIKMTRH